MKPFSTALDATTNSDGSFTIGYFIMNLDATYTAHLTTIVNETACGATIVPGVRCEIDLTKTGATPLSNLSGSFIIPAAQGFNPTTGYVDVQIYALDGGGRRKRFTRLILKV